LSWESFCALLARPVNGSSLAAFRFALGLVMALEAWSLFLPNPAAISSGSSPLATYYAGPDIKFHLPYSAFEWLPVLPAGGMYCLAVILAIAGLTTAVGFCYRISAVTLFLAWGYFFTIESTRTYWQSHYYLELLVTFLLIWMPAARVYSLDAWLARSRKSDRCVPFWTILLLRAQLVIAYFYAGVAKINYDWILDAVPVRWFLQRPGVTGPYARILSPGHYQQFENLVHSPAFAYFLSYTGLIFDLMVGFLLLCRRTRIFAFVLMVLFHATNHFLIFDDISWFPLLGVTSALIFLDPDWPERFWRWIRTPRISAPDWKWFAGGAILFPVVGTALGWKLNPTIPTKHQTIPIQLNARVSFLICFWILFQTILPLRHYFIPGDGRFTYEGLSFSWRLKADVHHALFPQLFVHDREVLSRDATSVTHVNWNQWHGEKVIYRKISPGHINWSELPEFFVIAEPLTGERIIYNPAAAPRPIHSEDEVRVRVHQAWQELYGTPLQGEIRRIAPLSQVLEEIAQGLRSGGNDEESRATAALGSAARAVENLSLSTPQGAKLRYQIMDHLRWLRGQDPGGALLPHLRRLPPFVLEGQQPRYGFEIEPGQFLDQSASPLPIVNKTLWKNPPTLPSPHEAVDYLGGSPTVVYMGDLEAEGQLLLPLYYMLAAPDQPLEICWNSPRDLTPSKLMHVSNQAFYLRRYARRVADLWQKEYGRRPQVTANTAVSFNGRPYQKLVDPAADLAGVPVKWFGHNPWISDLELPRVPRQALRDGSEFVGR
jgi:vitamin K-dependent gamma-carboxylase